MPEKYTYEKTLYWTVALIGRLFPSNAIGKFFYLCPQVLIHRYFRSRIFPAVTCQTLDSPFFSLTVNCNFCCMLSTPIRTSEGVRRFFCWKQALLKKVTNLDYKCLKNYTDRFFLFLVFHLVQTIRKVGGGGFSLHIFFLTSIEQNFLLFYIHTFFILFGVLYIVHRHYSK